ncbi:hypothetical protein E1B28_000555 [Marasmius oreades]|nr:uncharacterized protein E1B28_000555 [Marasmius oreades]KAG7098639.1 hypothetical protein E1B28_000555 [Marasmius oreades]
MLSQQQVPPFLLGVVGTLQAFSSAARFSTDDINKTWVDRLMNLKSVESLFSLERFRNGLLTGVLARLLEKEMWGDNRIRCSIGGSQVDLDLAESPECRCAENLERYCTLSVGTLVSKRLRLVAPEFAAVPLLSGPVSRTYLGESFDPFHHPV